MTDKDVWSDIKCVTRHGGPRDLALPYLSRGEEDPQLNGELLELFSNQFDMCAEFKKLNIYNCKFGTEPRKIRKV